MSGTAPPIDPRSTPEVVAQLVTLLEQYAPAWKDYDPLTREPRGRSSALIHIFARFSEIIIERLNQVPDKNLLAFLDLLGAARQPPQPARVPLTFTLAAGRTIDATVPQGTQVAAPPAAGEKDPVVFETQRPLAVTATELRSLVTLDPEQDSYGDWSARITNAKTAAFAVFRGDRALEHVLYLGDDQLLGYDGIKNLRVRFTLAAPLPSKPDERVVQWERWDGTRWQVLVPKMDPTQNLTVAGTVNFGDIPPQPQIMINQRTSRWLRCRLLTPITQGSHAVAGMVRASHLPKIKRIIAAVHLERPVEQGIAPELGFTNAAPLDLSKEFCPFGEKPKQLDAFFLASAESFSKDRTASVSYSSARIELDVQIANSHLLPSVSSVRPSLDLELTWECWTGSVWQRVGTSTLAPWLALLELDAVPLLRTENGTTFAILQGSAQVGAQVSSTVSGGSGAQDLRYLAVTADGRFADKRTLAAGVNVIEFTATAAGRSSKAWVTVFNGAPTVAIHLEAPLSPVSSEAIRLVVTLTGDEAARVQSVQLTNAATGEVLSVPFNGGEARFDVRLREGRNALLLEALADNRRLTATTTLVSRSAKAPQPGTDEFADGTFGLTQSGVITLRLPATTAKVAVNGQENFWLRARLVKGDYGKEATYVLKDPLKPEDGFILVPASFRPPIVSRIKIGYELTPRRWPELCFAYNDRTFVDCSAERVARSGSLAPFSAVADLERPALFLGFLPPPQAAFPNTTISLYHAAAASRYGELQAPLAPDASVRVGAAGSTVTHPFTITNDTAQRDTFSVALIGQTWPTTAPASVIVEAGGTVSLEVKVTIPASHALGDVDRSVLRLMRASDPEAIASAAITTGVEMLATPAPAGLTWQYWNGTRWAKLTVQDDTAGLTRSGLVEFLAPADFASRELFGQGRHWLRVVCDQSEYLIQPRMQRLLLNTTLALQTLTVANEVLGSSTGAANQMFRTTRAPVLEGQRLEVREQDGSVRDTTARPRETWVIWEEAPDFYGSSSGDRHYTINHLTGEVRFGDGVNGRIPPRGSSNVRLAQYRLGGGRRGNCAAGTVAQLKTTVPYVDKVVNPESAAGGAEAESTTNLRERMPRTLRHRDRAVTLEDYEDLALLVSSEVARTRCVPLHDLAADPLGMVAQPGAVSIVIVPRTSSAKPLPTLELIDRARDYLEQRAPATVSLAVVGPLYIRVDVRAEIAVATPGEASTVERNIYARLAAFLHPLSGGLDGSGWDFGRAPHRSDFFALLESVVGVDHVRYLDITEVEDVPGVRATERFLVYSGEHQISLTFEED